MRGCCLTGLLVAGLLAATPVGAQGIADFGDLRDGLRDEPIEISADILEYDGERRLYTATGNVLIRQSKRVIRADWVAFNTETGRGIASGNVEVEEKGTVLRASFIEFDVYGVEGVVRDGELESTRSSLHGEGRVIRKIGERSYRFEDARFTTCDCPDDEGAAPWEVVAEEAEVEVGGYATVRNSTVEILGVPVMWLPWMIYPVKTDRQSGVLLPELEIGSRNGFGLGIPLFWAAHDQLNLTLTPSYTTRRGGRVRGEVEHVFGDSSWGAVTAAYGYDEDIDPDTLKTPYSRNRWLLDGAQRWELPGELSFAARFDFMSDNDVPLDFEELRDRRADRYLISTASLGREFGGSGRYGAAAVARYASSQQNPDGRDRDKLLLQRLPGAEAVALSSPLPGLLAPLVVSVVADYAYFRRRTNSLGNRAGATVGPGGGFLDTGVDALQDSLEVLRSGQSPGQADDPHQDDFLTDGGTEDNGLFEEGEPLLDKGHRLWMHSTLSLPLRLGKFLELQPEVGWNQTFYDTDLQGNEYRGFLTARAELRSRLQGRVGDFIHVLEPRVGWALVRSKGQEDNPLFVPETAIPQRRIRALDLGAVTGDDADRIPRANELTFGVDSRFYREGGGLVGRFTLLALQDFEEKELTEVIVEGEARGLRGFWAELQGVFDPDRGRLDQGLARLGWEHDDGHDVNLGYRFRRDIPDTFERFAFADRFDDFRNMTRIEQLDAAFELQLTQKWLFGYRGAYSFDRDLLISNAARVEYGSACGCWAAGVEVSSDRAGGVSAKVIYRISGFGRNADRGRVGLLDAP